MAVIRNLTGKIRANGTAILCLQGIPDRAVEWRLLEGSGTLTPFQLMTDVYGRAACKFEAGGVAEIVVIGAAYVP